MKTAEPNSRAVERMGSISQCEREFRLSMISGDVVHVLDSVSSTFFTSRRAHIVHVDIPIYSRLDTALCSL